MRPQCLKLRSQCIAAAREDDSKEIVEIIEDNLEEDGKDEVSEEEEIPLKDKGNLNESSDKDIDNILIFTDTLEEHQHLL